MQTSRGGHGGVEGGGSVVHSLWICQGAVMRDVIGRYKFKEAQRREMEKYGILPMSGFGKASEASHKFTVDEYLRLAEVGVLNREDRVELVDGVIWQMAPIGRPHERRVNRLTRLLLRTVPDYIEVNIQGTIRLDDNTGPEPDITLLSPEASMDEENIPDSAGVLLAIEVSDSSLRIDRGGKARRYAQSSIPELWIFVLADDEIEVSRQPTADGYADVQRYRRGDTLTIQELPEIQLSVGELLA